jgi:hypothetical protein
MVADTIFVLISSCLLSENMVGVYCSLFLVKTKKKLNPSPPPPLPKGQEFQCDHGHHVGNFVVVFF